jgi:hypothetical protein
MIKVEPFFGFSDDSKRSFCSLFWFLDSEWRRDNMVIDCDFTQWVKELSSDGTLSFKKLMKLEWKQKIILIENLPIFLLLIRRFNQFNGNSDSNSKNAMCYHFKGTFLNITTFYLWVWVNILTRSDWLSFWNAWNFCMTNRDKNFNLKLNLFMHLVRMNMKIFLSPFTITYNNINWAWWLMNNQDGWFSVDCV